jgi:hypothetical protein
MVKEVYAELTLAYCHRGKVHALDGSAAAQMRTVATAFALSMHNLAIISLCVSTYIRLSTASLFLTVC